jgi:hypothetical protein
MMLKGKPGLQGISGFGAGTILGAGRNLVLPFGRIGVLNVSVSDSGTRWVACAAAAAACACMASATGSVSGSPSKNRAIAIYDHVSDQKQLDCTAYLQVPLCSFQQWYSGLNLLVGDCEVLLQSSLLIWR